MSVEAIVLSLLATVLVSSLITRAYVQGGRERRDIKKGISFYENAYERYRAKDYHAALILLGHSMVYLDSHDAYNLTALILEELGDFDNATSYWDSALSPSLVHKSDHQSYYYYRSSRAYSKVGNWEFAFIRADTGVTGIERGTLPRYVDGADYEDELRAMRMVASIHPQSGKSGFQTAKPDINWILACPTSKYHNLASSLSTLNIQLPSIVEALDRELNEPILRGISRN